MFQTLDRYLLRSVAEPFALTLVIAVLLLLLEQMLRLFDFVINENGPADVVWAMLLHLLPEYLGTALPLAAFIAMLAAARRLSRSSELDVIRGAGVSLRRLVRPLYVVLVPLMALHALVVGWVQPVSLYTYSALKFDARSGALGATVGVGEYVDLAQGVVLNVGGVERGGRILTDIFLERHGPGGRVVVTAERGEFLATADENVILLRLYQGRLLNLTDVNGTPSLLRFERQDRPIALPPIEAFRPRGSREEEATLPELWRLTGYGAPGDPDGPGGDAVATGPDSAAARAEWHWRLLSTLNFLPLPLLAFGLGVIDKRRDSGAGALLGLVTVIVYHEVMEAGRAIVASGVAAPWLAMWPIYAALWAFALWAFHVTGDRPGAPALTPLETAGQRLGALLGRLARRLRRRPVP
ncbi:lipopolysaccharide export system permease protein [Rhodothalassium salexigens DSM 2132]|uniref:Lipopolysaccharide export system permease protein LptF n=1 Tax=Rhodothalassium salexigens DSM 2132 TaxID=1188247 RepID=A0A4R2PIP9_RHOSA|nr:LPS export ABC transporter permease LptF [Rhodothalassium salexigens]MBB4211433.1 lipopolysaccharide export system permease protein [Rhodothalassium salexigens DSM 2132]TCP35353.1 lipopolysaccharide export system permease protein [Rhodothalassium salexigens DSM 2132]